MQFGCVVLTVLLAVGTDPLIGGSLLINLVQLILRGASTVRGLGRHGREHVTTDEAEIAQEFPELRVGNKEGDQDTKMSRSYETQLFWNMI